MLPFLAEGSRPATSCSHHRQEPTRGAAGRSANESGIDVPKCRAEPASSNSRPWSKAHLAGRSTSTSTAMLELPRTSHAAIWQRPLPG